jgi:hypothetical protein
MWPRTLHPQAVFGQDWTGGHLDSVLYTRYTDIPKCRAAARPARSCLSAFPLYFLYFLLFFWVLT